MKHSLFVEILTIGLILFFSFNWHKIYVRTKLRVKAFIRTHIADRVHPDLDLDFTPKAKVQPTGTENNILYPQVENKFLLQDGSGLAQFPREMGDIKLKQLMANTQNLNSRIPYQGNGQPVYIDRKKSL